MVANFRVRAASIHDLKKICEIEEVSFSRDPYPAFLFERLLDDENSLFYVATDDDGEVVGYLVSKIENHAVHLLSLAVAPTERRRGAATLLLGELIAASNRMGAGEIRLEVKPDNVPAIKLYSQLQFGDEILISRYYSDGSPALSMKRVIE